MKIINRLLIAVALLGTGSLAFAQDHGNDHGRGRDQGHQDRGHDDHGHDRGHYDRDHHGGDRGRDDHRWHADDHRGYGYREAPHYYGHPGYRPGRWERGRRYYGPTYVVRNYGYYRLRPPPRGYRWVRSDNDFLLVAITTGIILDIATH